MTTTRGRRVPSSSGEPSRDHAKHIYFTIVLQYEQITRVLLGMTFLSLASSLSDEAKKFLFASADVWVAQVLDDGCDIFFFACG